MIISRTITSSQNTNQIFKTGSFFVIREGENFASVDLQPNTVNFCPCDETGKPIIAETVSYTTANGVKAIEKFLELLPFEYSIKYKTR